MDKVVIYEDNADNDYHAMIPGDSNLYNKNNNLKKLNDDWIERNYITSHERCQHRRRKLKKYFQWLGVKILTSDWINTDKLEQKIHRQRHNWLNYHKKKFCWSNQNQ